MLHHLAHPFQYLELLGLLLLWAAFLFGGSLFGKLHAQGTRRMPTWTRLASSMTLLLAAWSWYLFTQDTSLSTFSLLIAIGMSLGCIGDLLLAELFPFPQPVLGGMAAFGLGHIAYIAALLLVGNQLHLTAPAARFGAWSAWVLIGLLGWYFLVLRGHTPTLLHWAALPYALLLASTAGFATSLALQDSTFLLLALGAALFLLSDLILAAQLFNNLQFPLIGDVIWLTYGPAQMLIVYTLGRALLGG
jgi:YhhN-like protein